MWFLGFETTAFGLIISACTVIGGSYIAYRWHMANVKKILSKRNELEIHEVK
jgi:hypothetical protein